jgi:hypothetical protein
LTLRNRIEVEMDPSRAIMTAIAQRSLTGSGSGTSVDARRRRRQAPRRAEGAARRETAGHDRIWDEGAGEALAPGERHEVDLVV